MLINKIEPREVCQKTQHKFCRGRIHLPVCLILFREPAENSKFSNVMK